MGGKSAPNDFDKACLQNALLQKRDLEDILTRTLSFTSEAYQRDMAFSRPVYNKEKKGDAPLFTFNANDTVDINDVSGGSMTFSLAHPPAIKIHETSTDEEPWIAVDFPSHLGFARDGRPHAIMIRQLALLKRKIEQYNARVATAAAAPAAAAAVPTRSDEEILRELEGKHYTAPVLIKGKKGSKSKSLPTTEAATSGGASGSAAAAAKVDLKVLSLSPTSAIAGASGSATAAKVAPEVLPPAAAGAGASGDDKDGKLPKWLQEKTLALAGMAPLPRRPLSSYASVAGAVRDSRSMDKDDKAMLANLLKANGDRDFGPPQKANTYNWAKLMKLLEHMGFKKTEDNYEFLYNGNSIKLHFIHWGKHELDDKSMDNMFLQMANIGLTEPVLRKILGIAPAPTGVRA